MTDPCSPLCPFRGCSTCDYQGGDAPVEEPVDTPTFPHHNGRIKAQHKSGPGGAGNTVNPGPNPWIGGAMGKPTHKRDRHGHFVKATIPGHVKVAVVTALGATPGTTTKVRCAYCPAEGEVWWPLTYTGKVGTHMVAAPFEFDHVTPEYKGGPTTADNIVLACQPCNRRKGHR